MRHGEFNDARRLTAMAAIGVWAWLGLAAGAPAPARADEPRGLGRIFRFGNRRDAEPPPPPARPDRARSDPKGAAEAAGLPTDVGAPGPRPGGGSTSPYRAGGGNPYGPATAGSDGYNPLLGTPGPPAASIPAPSAFTGPSSAPATAPPAPSTRLVPQPRVNRAVTEADPILTRVSIGRSDDGQHFGMFLQVHADGTVLDSEGVHRVGPDALRPLLEALRAADVGRLKGHCGGPPTDFVEQVHLTVYDQSRGRLVANHFSYSGNPQGCDPAIANLQAAIDAFQARLAGPPTTVAPSGPALTPPGGPSVAPLVPPASPDAQPISLTPIP